MISYLNGIVRLKQEKSLILDIGSIGYLVSTPLPTLEKLSTDDPVELYIHTRVREDEISLYGFETLKQMKFFETIISINGVGPKLGIEILSHNPEKIQSAIVKQDVLYLTSVPGIGKKTAERIIVELKNKIEQEFPLGEHQGLKQEENDDIMEALIKLGYQKYHISQILKKMPEEITEIEEIVTYFLRNV